MTEEEKKPDINFKMHIELQNGMVFGEISFAVKNIPKEQFLDLQNRLLDVVGLQEGLLKPKEPALVTKDLKEPEKPKTGKGSRGPKVRRGESATPMLVHWHHKFIQNYPNSNMDSLRRDFLKEYPNYEFVTKEKLTSLWKRYHPDCEISEDPGPDMLKFDKDIGQALADHDSERKFKPGDRVVQVMGRAPAHGVGEVQSYEADGDVKVKFPYNTKVLSEDYFKLADDAMTDAVADTGPDQE